MARVMLITFYDEFALGIRTLAPWIERHGHETTLCFFKKFKTATFAPYLMEAPHNYHTIHSVDDSGMFTCSGYDANPWTAREQSLLVELVARENPQVIGISTRNFIDDEICDLTGLLKATCPDAVLVAGGFGPTFNPERYLINCDYVVRGEGE